MEKQYPGTGWPFTAPRVTLPKLPSEMTDAELDTAIAQATGSAERNREIELGAEFHGRRIEARRIANRPWNDKGE